MFETSWPSLNRFDFGLPLCLSFFRFLSCLPFPYWWADSGDDDDDEVDRLSRGLELSLVSDSETINEELLERGLGSGDDELLERGSFRLGRWRTGLDSDIFLCVRDHPGCSVHRTVHPTHSLTALVLCLCSTDTRDFEDWHVRCDYVMLYRTEKSKVRVKNLF